MAATLLFHNARLIDGLTDQPRSKASFVITGERITSVEQGPLPVPAGAQLIDLQGKTVVPGLIDTHVHSTFVGTPSLPLFLAAGVTSARDVGGNLEKVKGLKADLNSGKKLGRDCLSAARCSTVQTRVSSTRRLPRYWITSHRLKSCHRRLAHCSTPE